MSVIKIGFSLSQVPHFYSLRLELLLYFNISPLVGNDISFTKKKFRKIQFHLNLGEARGFAKPFQLVTIRIYLNLTYWDSESCICQ